VSQETCATMQSLRGRRVDLDLGAPASGPASCRRLAGYLNPGIRARTR
jgi:hypothetical protein